MQCVTTRSGSRASRSGWRSCKAPAKGAQRPAGYGRAHPFDERTQR
jgi:hypothetical protein